MLRVRSTCVCVCVRASVCADVFRPIATESWPACVETCHDMCEIEFEGRS